MNQIWLAFLAGLTTGGISCFAVQGGLLASSIPEDQKGKSNGNKYILVFILSKLIAYSLLGLFLGLIGSAFVVSIKAYIVLQILIGIFLIGTSLRLLNIHPIFRYFAITPPKTIFKLLRNRSKNSSFITPIILGSLTILIPCGVTQAMMMVAIGAGNPLISALIMFAFVLGTAPVFFALGATAVEFLKRKSFAVIAAVLIFIMGVISINGALVLSGSVHTLQNYKKVLFSNNNTSNTSAVINSGVQEVIINVKSNGYTANVNTLKVDTPVRLKIVTNNIFSCARAFTIPEFNISKILPETGEEIIEFTPTKTGRLVYSCSMGMYTGSFQVIP